MRRFYAAANRKLLAVRKQRIHPLKDDKILTSWNGLMIAALAKGYQALRDPLLGQAAARAADFILTLCARIREGSCAGIAMGMQPIRGMRMTMRS